VWWTFCVLCSLWALGAIRFDAPLGREAGNLVLAGLWLVVVIVLLAVVKGVRNRSLAWAACFLAVLLPWLAVRPSHDRDWQAVWAKTGWVEVEGDLVAFHNFRNFDYALDGTVTERWETRTVRLSNLQGLDCFLVAFGGEWLAHPILSFDFGPDGRVAFSIETRREVGESYSEFGGLYKMFELAYMFGDERDFVRVRTNLRDEPIYLYRGHFPQERVRGMFLESVAAANDLRDRPRFYNVLAANCTTSLRAQTPAENRNPFDIRLLLNGKLDELVYERGGLRTDGLPFAELRRRAFINAAARAAHDDPAFSERIREGRPGFSDPEPEEGRL
jgi:hypothetical protein